MNSGIIKIENPTLYQFIHHLSSFNLFVQPLIETFVKNLKNIAETLDSMI